MMPHPLPPPSQKLEQLLKEEREARRALEKELQEAKAALSRAEDRFAGKLEEQSLKLERALQQTRDANRVKSIFLCNVSHEVRTPLNGILGMAALLAETKLCPQQTRFLDSLQKSADSLLLLLNDILDYSKIVAGKLHLEETVASPQQMTQSLIDIVSSKARAKGLKLSLQVSPTVPHKVILDRTRVGQVIMNLLTNAIKYSEMGEVKLSVFTCTGPKLVFEVSDTGQGISREHKDRVFELFYQTDGRTNQMEGGTGLGLALCRGLIELMEGTIELESELGHGSRFTVRLPLIASSDNSVTPGALRLPDAEDTEEVHTLSILVVEDNEINQLYAATVLESVGHIVTVANNGLEGLQSVRRIKPDLILMDIQMPQMDGLEATRRIRQEELPGQRTPIIALTAQATADDKTRCEEAGMDGYLTKPIRKDRLVSTVAYYAKLAKEAEIDEETKRAIRNLASRLNDIQDVRLLGRLFSRRYPEHCRAIEEALKTHDNTLVLQATSGLKGSFLSFEFSEGTEMLRNLERLVRKKKWSQAQLLAPLLFQMCADLEKQITTFLPSGLEEHTTGPSHKIKREAGVVLLVDDEETNRLIGRRMLERQGHHVIEARDGNEAIQIVQREDVDVVVMDVVMPNLNGVEACRQLKRSLRTQHIPVILLTSLEDENERLAGIEAGADDYVSKPLRGRETFVKIRNSIRYKKLFSDLDDKYEKLQDLEEMRSNLGHMLVHDMRGALSGVIGYAQLLLMDAPMFRQDHRSLIRQIEVSSMMLNEMMSAVIDVSRLENESLPLNLGNHELSKLVEREVRFYGELPDANIFLHLETQNKTRCDASLIRRVVINLLTNALKHSGSGELVEVAVIEKKDFFLVRVTDRGPGIPEHLTESIFDKFTQIHGDSGPRAYSSGLGLTFCKLVVESHNGQIGVDSQVGEGSSFWFKLPKESYSSAPE